VSADSCAEYLPFNSCCAITGSAAQQALTNDISKHACYCQAQVAMNILHIDQEPSSLKDVTACLCILLYHMYNRQYHCGVMSGMQTYWAAG